MLEINANLHIPDDELHWTFVRSGGPGGQNVNKVASKAVLRWNAAGNTSLPVHVKARLVAVEKTRLTAEGDLLFTSQRFREQERQSAGLFGEVASAHPPSRQTTPAPQSNPANTRVARGPITGQTSTFRPQKRPKSRDFQGLRLISSRALPAKLQHWPEALAREASSLANASGQCDTGPKR